MEGRARAGGSSRLPEETWWERRLPPLQRAGARPRSGRPWPPLPPVPPPPGELWIRLHVAWPGCWGKARRGATPSSQQRPVVVKCREKTECSSSSVVRFPPPPVLGSVCVVESRQFSRVSASVSKCISSPLHSTRSPGVNNTVIRLISFEAVK